MTIAITISAIAGMAIGFRFKVFFVALAVIVAASLTAALAVASGTSFWSALASVALSAAAVQTGYLCGTFAAAMREVPAALEAPAVSGEQLATVRVRDKFPV